MFIGFLDREGREGGREGEREGGREGERKTEKKKTKKIDDVYKTKVYKNMGVNSKF